MARMPQIPEPDLSSRPDSRVGQAELPDSEAVAKPFADAAETVGGIGDKLEDIQAQRDAAMEKAQNMADQVEVTRKNQVVTGFFERTLRDVQKTEFVCFPAFSESFRDICGNGHGGAAKLR